MPGKSHRILLIAATKQELDGLALGPFKSISVETMVSGVGMVATSFALTKKLMEKEFDFVLNIGIAGAFLDELEIGEVVYVESDHLVELGAEDGDKFIPADDLGLIHWEDLSFMTNLDMRGRLFGVAGITVNRVHGNAKSIKETKKQFKPDVESMEGAAVGYVCWKMGLTWLQIRAISNRVEPRNRDNWAIGLAITNLHVAVAKYLKQMDDEA